MDLRTDTKRIPSEILKLIACACMLIDHSAVVFISMLRMQTIGTVSVYIILRGIGRIAFPIYCWMMAEGIHYTKDPKKYGIRLLIGAILSELPFDYALHGGLDWGHQSVMLTLLIAFCAVEIIRHVKSVVLQVLTVLTAYVLATVLHTDYGGNGVLLVILLYASRGNLWFQAVITAVMCYLIGGLSLTILGIKLPLEMYGVLAMIPISLSSGKKLTNAKWVTTAFYLFYPGHLAILWLLKILFL